MDKRLTAHYNYIKKQIAELKDKPSAKQLDATITYHRDMVRNFQHERLIHLIVTFFFVAITLVGLGLDLFLILKDTDPTIYPIITVFSVIIAILAVTSAFYVRHYYRLENGTEKLYDLTKQLYELN